ncbi:MAG: HNH endonuclease [Cytophagales bacterium]|nr:HNH endonuclease [Cytophagales bacterium]
MYSSEDILWVKNIKKDDGNAIAYYAPEDEDEFWLNWSSRYIDEKEALKPEIGDLILLFQKTNITGSVQLTHLVTPVDYHVKIGNLIRYKWERKVRVVARAPNAYNPKPNSLDFLRPNRGGSYEISLLDPNGTLPDIQTNVWNSFQGMFKENVQILEEEILNQNLGPIDIEALEGIEKIVYQKHILRERVSKLVKTKKSQATEANRMFCECCSFDFVKQYGDLGEGFIECHHKIPISQGARINNLDDLALVCSNCHRMLHRRDIDGEYLSVQDLQDLIKGRKQA